MNAIEDMESAARTAGIPTGAATRLMSGAAHPRECLTLRLGAEEYGIDILRVQEIRGYENPTRIADTRLCIKGVLNLRGVIVPVVDLRIAFGLDHVGYDALTVTVVLNIAGRTVGVVVDSVSDVIKLTGEQIKPAPQFNSAVDASYVIGIGAIKQGDRERMLILMDIERLMSSTDMGLAMSRSLLNAAG